MKDLKNKTTKELEERRAWLARANWKEYTTRGNTPRCQELFEEGERIEEELNLRRACKK